MIIRKKDLKNRELENWVEDYANYLRAEWGLQKAFADKMALLQLYAAYAGIPYKMNSGFRDPAKQKRMQRRWDAGDRRGLVVRPVNNSPHILMKWGRPDSVGADISSADLTTLGHWAKFFGMRWGGFFRKPDRVHFDHEWPP